jgi:multidrug efflux system membrane fusion protein
MSPSTSSQLSIASSADGLNTVESNIIEPNTAASASGNPPANSPHAPGAPRSSGWGPRVVFGVAFVGLAALVGVGVVPKLNRRAELQAVQGTLGQPRLVTFAQAKVGDATGKVVLPGTAAPIETAIIYARTNGFVRDVKVDIGDRVKAGDVLAVLDTPEMESDARSAKARADETARNAKIIRATADRHTRLAQEGVSSLQQAEEAEARANSAEAALLTSRSDVDRWSTLLSFRYVRAPFSGVVTRRNVEKGSLVTAGSSSGVASLYELARMETLKVLVDVPQSLAQDIRVGESAQVSASSGALTVEGRVARTSGALDPSTRTLRTEVHVPGDKGILAGSFVRVALNTHAATPPVRVPANALAARAAGNFVFVIGDNNKIEEKKVTLGRELGAEVELVMGLTGNEKVVTNPPESLSAGETVRLVEKKSPAAP